MIEHFIDEFFFIYVVKYKNKHAINNRIDISKRARKIYPIYIPFLNKQRQLISINILRKHIPAFSYVEKRLV